MELFELISEAQRLDLIRLIDRVHYEDLEVLIDVATDMQKNEMLPMLNDYKAQWQTIDVLYCANGEILTTDYKEALLYVLQTTKTPE